MRKSILERRFWDIFYVFTFGGTVEQLGRNIESSLRDEEERKVFLDLLREELKKMGYPKRKIEKTVRDAINWTNSVWEKPKILGENFSYNLLITPYALFSRYLLTKVITNQEEIKSLDNFFKFSEDITFGDRNFSRWLRRDTTLAQRVFAFPTMFLKTRTNTKLLFALFTLKLFESEFAKGEGKKQLIRYLTNLIQEGCKGGILKEEEYVETEKVFKEWKEWMKEKIPMRKNTVGDYVVMRKSRTMLSSNIMSARWVTKRIARELRLERGQSDEEFFPELHEVVMEKLPELEKETFSILASRRKIPKERAEELLKEIEANTAGA